MLVVHNVEGAVSDEDAVPGAKSALNNIRKPRLRRSISTMGSVVTFFASARSSAHRRHSRWRIPPSPLVLVIKRRFSVASSRRPARPEPLELVFATTRGHSFPSRRNRYPRPPCGSSHRASADATSPTTCGMKMRKAERDYPLPSSLRIFPIRAAVLLWSTPKPSCRTAFTGRSSFTCAVKPPACTSLARIARTSSSVGMASSVSPSSAVLPLKISRWISRFA